MNWIKQFALPLDANMGSAVYKMAAVSGVYCIIIDTTFTMMHLHLCHYENVTVIKARTQLTFNINSVCKKLFWYSIGSFCPSWCFSFSVCVSDVPYFCSNEWLLKLILMVTQVHNIDCGRCLKMGIKLCSYLSPSPSGCQASPACSEAVCP